MGAEHEQRTLGHLCGVFHEHRTLGPQRIHDVTVVHDLVAHIDGSTEALEGLLDNLNRPVHTRAEAAGARKEDAHGAQSSRAAPPERG